MLMHHILIVEDELLLNKLYAAALRKAGFETCQAANGKEAWDILEKTHIDLILTDIQMPVMDGYELLESVHEVNPAMPVMMISCNDDFPSKTRGFTLGADDYLTKPVHLNELVLRVQALLRRANINSARQLSIGRTSLDYDSLTVTTGSESVMLPQKEFMLLYKILSYPGNIFTRVQLMDEIWGQESASDMQTVDVHINRLRKRFGSNRDFKIVTVRGLGYKAESQRID